MSFLIESIQQLHMNNFILQRRLESNTCILLLPCVVPPFSPMKGEGWRPRSSRTEKQEINILQKSTEFRSRLNEQNPDLLL